MTLKIILVVHRDPLGVWESAAYPLKPREFKAGHGAASRGPAAAAMAVHDLVTRQLKWRRAK